MQIKIYKTAKKQIIQIWHYTKEKWGEEQANRYVTGLYEFLEKNALCQELWKKIDYENMEDIYYCKYKKHFIFFKKLSGQGLGVISILHEKMNIPTQLKNDL